jgi:hypothetical protein
MRDLARDMVQDVSLRDTMGHSCAEPGRDAAQVAEQAAVEGGEGTTGEGELGGTVMGNEGVSVL